MTLLVLAPDGYAAERRYVMDLVLHEWLGLDYEIAVHEGSQVVIRLLTEPQGSTLTLPDGLFGAPREDWLTERSLPQQPLARLSGDAFPTPDRRDDPWDLATSHPVGGPIPVLFGSHPGGGPAWYGTCTDLSMALDVFGAVFFLLTRYEEIVNQSRDAHGRFPRSASIASAEAFLDRPLVDEYVDLLWMAMRVLWPRLVPRPKAFQLWLTHDVDHVRAAVGRPIRVVARAVGGDLTRRHDPGLAARRIRAFAAGATGRDAADPFDTFDSLMDTSEQHMMRSTFYFMTGGTGAPLDGSYRLSDRPIARLLERIHERGHDVGLHASYESFRSPERIRREREMLERATQAAGFDQPLAGVRQHYLRFDNPLTWRAQEAAGFEHDSTLGLADDVGFRAGTGRDYPVFDLLEGRRMRLRERPLLVMDTALLETMGLGLEEAARRAAAVVAASRRHAGDAVVLYHNSSLTGPRQRDHYRGLIDELARDRRPD